MGNDFIDSLTYEELARLENAARIVESQELLIWYSTARNETISQTRMYYTKILAGMDPDADPPAYPERLFDAKAEARQKAAAAAAKAKGNGSGSGSRNDSARSGDSSRRKEGDAKDNSKRKRTGGVHSTVTSN